MGTTIKNIAMFRFFFCLALLTASYQSWGQGSCTEELVNKCRADGIVAGATSAVASGGAYNSAKTGEVEAKKSGANMAAAAKNCKDSAKMCQKCPEHERESCKQAVEQAAGQMEAQSAAMNGAGDAMGAIAGMLGAMLPLLMNQNQQEEDPQQQQQPFQNMSADLGNGQIDCSKRDAYNFPDCNDHLRTRCKTTLGDPMCASFASRYCATTYSPPSRKPSGIPVGGSGEGRGDPFCDLVDAYNYCKVGGRDGCPSCLNLQAGASEGCRDNPALCLAQNSPEQWDRYKNSCPGDPIYQTPAYLAAKGGASGGSGGGSTLQPLPTAPNAGGSPGGAPPPNVVLPTSGSTGGSGTQQPLQPPSLVNPPGGGTAIAAREGRANGSANANGGISNGGTVSVFSMVAKDRLAGGGAMDRTAASAGPAPDVQGPYGPNLFSVGTRVLRNKCAAGQFLNCP